MNKDLIENVLEKHGLPFISNIHKYTGGQVNEVYQIGDIVLKIENDLDVVPHQIELFDLARKAEVKVPKVFGSGQIDEKNYILMERIEGKKLSQSWHLFSENEKKDYIRQIVVELKKLHSISFDTYSPQRPQTFGNFKDAIVSYTSCRNDFTDGQLETFGDHTRQNLDTVKDFFDSNIDLLDETDTAVFVHNDFHFENILYKGSTITGLIDLDFSRHAPKDYELWHLLDFFAAPKYYVEEELEGIWENYTLEQELKWFKEFYPTLFSHKDLLSRVRLYLTEDIISTLQDGAVNKFNEKVDLYFGSDWLEDVLLS